MLRHEIVRYERSIAYRKHGQRHRLKGPAFMYDYGEIVWFQYGEWHRLDGPYRIADWALQTEYYRRGYRYDP